MWISVKDRLPKDGSRVDAWHRGSGRMPDCLCGHIEGGTNMALWYPSNSNDVFKASISHWMPIPAPPEEFRDGAHRRLE